MSRAIVLFIYYVSSHNNKTVTAHQKTYRNSVQKLKIFFLIQDFLFKTIYRPIYILILVKTASTKDILYSTIEVMKS